MTQRDNWGWQARIGMFIVGSEVVPEAEWWAMVPLNVSVHAARVTARAPWARWRDDRSGVELEDDLLRGCRQFAPMCLSAVVVGHSSSSILGGPQWDEAVVETLSRELGGGVAVTTNGLDCAAALQASGVNRPFLVFPPWFDDSLVAAGVRDWCARGTKPAGHLRYDPGRQWRDVPPGELYRQGMGIEQAIEPLYQQVRAACPQEADSVLIAGTGFRCVGILVTGLVLNARIDASHLMGQTRGSMRGGSRTCIRSTARSEECLIMSLQHGVLRTMGLDASATAAGRPFLAVSHPARAQYRATPDRPAFPATSSVVGQSAWPAYRPGVGVLRRRECQRRATAAEAPS